jgi:hypothetical protein
LLHANTALFLSVFSLLALILRRVIAYSVEVIVGLIVGLIRIFDLAVKVSFGDWVNRTKVFLAVTVIVKIPIRQRWKAATYRD